MQTCPQSLTFISFIILFSLFGIHKVCLLLPSFAWSLCTIILYILLDYCSFQLCAFMASWRCVRSNIYCTSGWWKMLCLFCWWTVACSWVSTSLFTAFICFACFVLIALHFSAFVLRNCSDFNLSCLFIYLFYILLSSDCFLF